MNLQIPPIDRESHYGRAVLAYRDRPTTFNEVVARAVERRPDRVALVFEDRRWTYAELWQRAHSFAAAIYGGYGITKGDRVAVLTGNEPAFAIAAIGISLLGAILVPLNTRRKTAELLFMLENSGSRILVATAEQWQKLAGDRYSLPDLMEVFLVNGRPTGDTRRSIGPTRRQRPVHFCRRAGFSPATSRASMPTGSCTSWTVKKI